LIIPDRSTERLWIGSVVKPIGGMKGRRCASAAAAIPQATEEFGGTPIIFEEQTVNHRCEAIFGA
jgi:hypothetical protein